MFRFVVAVLAGFGLAALLLGGPETTGVGFGLLLLAPLLFLAKIVFFFMIFGALGRVFFHGPSRRHWGDNPEYRPDREYAGPWGRRRPTRASREEPRQSAEDRFVEWHRMAHAKEEVDSWTADLPDVEL